MEAGPFGVVGDDATFFAAERCMNWFLVSNCLAAHASGKLAFIVMSRFDIDFGVLPDILVECALLLQARIAIVVYSERRQLCEGKVFC